MKRSIFLFLLFSIMILLTGCGPFGMSQDQWRALTPEQQNQVIQGYNERERINAVNAPIVDAINAAATIAGNTGGGNSASGGAGTGPCPALPPIPAGTGPFPALPPMVQSHR